MAVIQTGYDPGEARREALKNLQKQEQERLAAGGASAVRSGAEGVKTIEQGYQQLAGRVTDKAKEVATKPMEFQAPSVGGGVRSYDQGAQQQEATELENIRLEALKGLTPAQQVDPVAVSQTVERVTQEYLDKKRQERDAARTTIGEQADQAEKKKEDLVKSYQDFIDKVRKSSIYTGQSAQLSEVQQADQELAKAMSDVNVPVGDIGLMSQAVTNFDSEMSSLYSGVLGGQMEQARMDALAALGAADRAQAGVGEAVSGLADEEKAYGERLTKATDEAQTAIDKARAEALARIKDAAAPRAFDAGGYAKEQESVALQRVLGTATRNVEDLAKRVEQAIQDPNYDRLRYVEKDLAKLTPRGVAGISPQTYDIIDRLMEQVRATQAARSAQRDTRSSGWNWF